MLHIEDHKLYCSKENWWPDKIILIEFVWSDESYPWWRRLYWTHPWWNSSSWSVGRPLGSSQQDGQPRVRWKPKSRTPSVRIGSTRRPTGPPTLSIPCTMRKPLWWSGTSVNAALVRCGSVARIKKVCRKTE